jgi:hypothetical protein
VRKLENPCALTSQDGETRVDKIARTLVELVVVSKITDIGHKPPENQMDVFRFERRFHDNNFPLVLINHARLIAPHSVARSLERYGSVC